MKEHLQRLANSRTGIPIVVGAVSLSAGIGIGYFLGKRQNHPQLHVVPDQVFDLHTNELEELRDEPKLPEGITTSEKSEEVLTVHQKMHHEEPFTSKMIQEVVSSKMDEEGEAVESNIFARDSEDWNYEEEVSKRTKDAPFILHRDEFFEEETPYRQSTLTYYAGDDILVDEDDSIIYNPGQRVGELKFGHGSGDPIVFYVRNDKYRADYEVIRDPGKYTVEVAGLDDMEEIQHNDLKHSRQPHKFRMD